MFHPTFFLYTPPLTLANVPTRGGFLPDGMVRVCTVRAGECVYGTVSTHSQFSARATSFLLEKKLKFLYCVLLQASRSFITLDRLLGFQKA